MYLEYKGGVFLAKTSKTAHSSLQDYALNGKILSYVRKKEERYARFSPWQQNHYSIRFYDQKKSGYFK